MPANLGEEALLAVATDEALVLETLELAGPGGHRAAVELGELGWAHGLVGEEVCHGLSSAFGERDFRAPRLACAACLRAFCW